MYDQAIEVLSNSNSKWQLGWVYGLNGEREKADEILNEYLKRQEKGENVAWSIAWIYLGQSDYDNAITSFEKSYNEFLQNNWIGNLKFFINAIEDLKVLHSNPRFQALLEKVNSTKL